MHLAVQDSFLLFSRKVAVNNSKCLIRMSTTKNLNNIRVFCDGNIQFDWYIVYMYKDPLSCALLVVSSFMLNQINRYCVLIV